MASAYPRKTLNGVTCRIGPDELSHAMGMLWKGSSLLGVVKEPTVLFYHSKLPV